MTFSEIVSAVLEDANFAASPASAVTTRVKRYVNEGVRKIVGKPGLSRLLDSDSPFTVASVASQARYVIPEAAARILTISERTNDWALLPMSIQEYRHREPYPASVTGTPTHYVPIGRVGVAVQPSDASEIFVDSTSASDTGTAYLEGLITGGYRRVLSKTMTGVTAVSFDTTVTTFETLEDFYISANAVGTVTLHEDASGGTELARITIGQKRPRYYGFYLWPTPAAAVTYYVDYRRRLVELVNDADEPPIDEDYHYLIVAYACMREYEKSDDDRYANAKTAFKEGMSDLTYNTQTLPDELPVASRRRRIGHSRLGGYYPADYYTR